MSTEHPDIEILSAYADGEVDAPVVADIERHLSACASCREQLRRVRALVETAGALPHEVDPPADVWSDVRRTIAARRSRVSWRRTAGWLAAAAVLLVAGTLLLRSWRERDTHFASKPPIPATLVSVDRSYEPAIGALRQTLDAQRETLSPSTVRVLEHSLAVIDTAIAEARAALAADPANAELSGILAAQYRVKVDLLQRATKLSSSL